MKPVRPTSTSLVDRTAPTWLHDKVYAPRRQRTRDLVRQAVETLVSAEQAVSLASIAAMSKVLDPAGRGISTSAILGNPEARAHWERHRRWRGTRPARRTTPPGHPPARPRVAAERDVARARQRYLRWTKTTLVERLLAAEHAWAEQEERWLRVNDELLAWRLRAESVPEAVGDVPALDRMRSRPSGATAERSDRHSAQ
jgi:hypothetical protein